MISTRVFTAITAVLLFQVVASLGGEFSDGVVWVDDYKEAMRIARRESRPLLLDFWTTWCPPCRTMEEKFWPDPEVVALTRKFVCVKIDGDHARGLVARFRANTFPTLLFLDPWGEEMTRLSGYDHDDTLVLLRGLPGDFSPIVAAHARAKHDRKSLQPLLTLGRFYDEHELYQISTEFYEKAVKTREAKENREVMADLMTSIGWNYMKIDKHRKARKTFERCLKKAGDHPGLDRTLYGLFSACLSLDENGEAHEALARLRVERPDSDLVERASRELGAAGQ
jgi:thiol-disulfide isomerase/thioredoxin